MLANRPGFPFLGNDFYKVIGSAFSAFAVDNADADSELEMLRKYGSKVQEKVLQQLIVSFNDLRRLVEEGKLSYPYSTRELSQL